MTLFINTIIFLLGLTVGSFVNVLTLRGLRGEPIVRGRSHCAYCARTLVWYELIPVISFLIQRGRCRSCASPILLQYPLVEFITAVLFVALWRRLPLLVGEGGGEVWLTGHLGLALLVFIGMAAVFALLVALFITDARAQVLPDWLTVPAIVIGAVTALGVGASHSALPDTAIAVFIAMAFGGGFFALQWLVSRGRWIGTGDIRFGILMGALLAQWTQVAIALFLSYVGGALVSLVLIATHRATRTTAVPFGIFLIPATIATFFWGDVLLAWYMGLVGLS